MHIRIALSAETDMSNFSRVGSFCDSDKNPPTTRNPQRAKSRFGPSRDYKSQDAALWASEAPPFPRWPSLGAALGAASSRFPRLGRAMEAGFCWFGGEFEDSVFEERRERRPGPSGSYRAKRCEPQVRGRSLSVPPGLVPAGPGARPAAPPVSPSPHEARASPEPHPVGPAQSACEGSRTPRTEGDERVWPLAGLAAALQPSLRPCCKIRSNSRVSALILQPGSQGPQKSVHHPLLKP